MIFQPLLNSGTALYKNNTDKVLYTRPAKNSTIKNRRSHGKGKDTEKENLGNEWKCLLIRQRGQRDGVLMLPENGRFVGWAAYLPGQSDPAMADAML